MSRINYPSPYVITQDRVGSDLVFENITSQCNGSRTTFTLNQAADVERIFVYYNGLLSNIDISSTTETTFTLGFAPFAEDTLQVIYSVKGNPLNEDNS
jgi:hypothetical protein|tara:strand:+ start:230 stop:523 length:294 start_codon:yes stop_codon:yes gene_type:complete